VYLLTIGLNHKTAPVEVREKLNIPRERVGEALARLRAEVAVREAALLSTCNRSEMHLVIDDWEDALRGATAFLERFHGCVRSEFEKYLYHHVDRSCVGHLFRVASGIDSMIVGESQILSQVKAAFDVARAEQSARLVLDELFRRALRVGKRSRTETDISAGALSVGSAAVELAKTIFGDLDGRAVMLLGAGEMGELTARHLLDNGVTRFLVANRSLDRATELARAFGGEPVRYDTYSEHLKDVDILISSTSAPHFVVTRDAVALALRKRRDAPLFFIDIAVPRDVEPVVNRLENAFVYDIDDIQAVVAGNRAERDSEVSRVETIVEREVNDFMRWFQGLAVRPVIASLTSRAQQIRDTEVEQALRRMPDLSQKQQEIIRALGKGIAQKILHAPIVHLRQSSESQDGYVEVETVRRLFNLEVTREEENAHRGG